MENIALLVLLGACAVVTVHAGLTGWRRLRPAGVTPTLGWSDDGCCRVMVAAGLAWTAASWLHAARVPRPVMLLEGGLITCVVTVAALVMASWFAPSCSQNRIRVGTVLGMALATVVGTGLS